METQEHLTSADEPVGSRLMQIIKYYGLNKNSFSKKIGMDNNTTVVRIVNESNRGISYDILRKVGNTFHDIDMNWLVMGTGSMFKIAKTSPKGEVFNIKYFHGDSETASDVLHITGYKDCDVAYDDVFGDSMAPKLIAGDIMLCKTISPNEVIFGEAYRIVTKGNDVFIRYIINADDEQLILSTENQRYRDSNILRSDIDKLYLIKGVVRRVAY